MSDEDFIATTDERGHSIEYLPKSQVQDAFKNGFWIGVLVTGMLWIIVTVIF